MKTIKLKDIADLITCGVAKRPEYVDYGIPFLSSKNVKKDRFILDDYKYISKETHEKLTKYNKPTIGDILYTRVGSFGEAAVINFKMDFSIFVSLTLIKLKEELAFSRYIMHYLNSPYVMNLAKNTTRGIGVQNLNVSTVRNFPVPLPPLNTQKKIVAVLDKAQELIDLRKQQIDLLDDLIQSIFYDMFGDPVTNPKGWEVKKLGEVCLINPKKSEVKSKKNLFVTFLPMSSVSEKGNIDTSETRKMDSVYKGFTYFKENDILFAKITPCMENGKGCIAKNLKNGIGFGSTEFHVVRPLQLVTPEFVFFLTASKQFRDFAEVSMKGAVGQKRVPADFLSKFSLPIPSINLQTQFAVKVKLIEEQKELMQKSLYEMENNFNSLMQRAFKGELF